MGHLSVEIARPLDFLEALDVEGRPYCRNRRAFGIHARQVSGSEAVTFRAGGELVCIAGLYRNPDETWEAWLACGPAFRANLRAVLYDLRADLAIACRLIGAGKPVTVLAYIDPASVAGDRLARGLGFQPCGLTPSPIGPLKTWRRLTP